MSASRLFIGLADTVKVTTNYSWSAWPCLQPTQRLHRLCQPGITPLTFLRLCARHCVWAYVFFPVTRRCARACVYSYVLGTTFLCFSVRFCLVSFGSLAFFPGFSLTVTWRLLLLLPRVIYFSLVFVQPSLWSKTGIFCFLIFILPMCFSRKCLLSLQPCYSAAFWEEAAENPTAAWVFYSTLLQAIISGTIPCNWI